MKLGNNFTCVLDKTRVKLLTSLVTIRLHIRISHLYGQVCLNLHLHKTISSLNWTNMRLPSLDGILGTVTIAPSGILYSLSFPSQGWSSSTLGFTSVYVYIPTLKGSKNQSIKWVLFFKQNWSLYSFNCSKCLWNKTAWHLPSRVGVSTQVTNQCLIYNNFDERCYQVVSSLG